MIDRDEAIERLKAALKTKTGKAWSVTGGRGTAWSWITVQAPPKQRDEYGYTAEPDRKMLAEVFDMPRAVHSLQGVLISPEDRERLVLWAEQEKPQ